MKTSAARKFRFRNVKVLISIASIFLIVAILTLSKLNPFNKGIDPKVFSSKNYQEFELQAKKVGAARAYIELKKFFKNNESEAHDFAHVIGFVAVEQGDLAGIKVCDNYFNYGCYHGFMQVYLKKHGVPSVVDMEKSCLALGSASAPSCLHGTGHGLMMEAGYDLNDALKNCDLLAPTSRTYCFDGVFMERIAGSMLPFDKRLKVIESSLMEPCASIDKIYRRECWRNQVSVWFQFFGGDTKKVGAYCAALTEDFWQTCFESIGLINSMNIGENLNKLADSCAVVNVRARDFCLVGEMKELLFEGKSVQLAQSICGIVSQDARQNCLGAFEQQYSDFRARFGT